MAVLTQERIGSLPVSRTRIVSFVRALIFSMMWLMLQKPAHFCRYSIVINFVFGSVELTRSEGGMMGKLKASLSGDGTELKKESSISVKPKCDKSDP